MAQVPYNPVAQVETEPGRIPDRQVAGISAAAFGGDVAQGLESIGKAVGDVGGELWTRAVALQKLANETEARNADAEYTIQAGELSAEYNAAQGMDAITARPKYIANLRALRERMMVGMKNSDTRRTFADSSLGTLSRLTLYSATHMATENRKYMVGSADAQIAAAANQAASLPDDPENIADARRKAAYAVRVKNGIGGVSPEAAAVADTETQSTITRVQIEAIADKDPWKAGEMLEAARKNYGMTATDVRAAERIVEDRQRQVGSRQIAGRVNADLDKPEDPNLPEKSIGVRTKEAEVEAERLRPGDELFKSQAVAQVSAGYARRKAEIRDTDLRNRHAVQGAIIGETGTLPTNVDELRAISPAMSQSWDDLSPEGKRGALRAMAQNAKGDVPETPATIRDFLKYRGMATSDNNDEREKFLYLDVADLRLPLKDRRALGLMQQKIKNGSIDDPRVSRAYRQLLDAGIAPSKANASDEDVLVFRGGLQEALDVWQQENKGKTPKLEDIKRIGSELTRTLPDPNRWSWGIGANNVPMYQMKVPDEFREIAVKEATVAGAPVPDDAALARQYIRMRYRQMRQSGAQPKS